jgi:hypothetical protein
MIAHASAKGGIKTVQRDRLFWVRLTVLLGLGALVLGVATHAVLRENRMVAVMEHDSVPAPVKLIRSDAALEELERETKEFQEDLDRISRGLPRIIRWQYKTVPANDQYEISRMGGSGWILVTSSTTNLVFKRQK